MGISRDSRHKHRLTGGRRNIHQKKRKYELGRQAAQTKIGAKRIVDIRTRGGNHKFRALRLETGNFSWGSECCTRRTRVLDVVYNASNNELVRTKTLVKSAIIQVDATPFRQWYEQHYGVTIGKKKVEKPAEKKEEAKKAADDKSKKASDDKSKKASDDKSKKASDDKSKKASDDKSKKASDDKSKKASDDKSKKPADKKSEAAAKPTKSTKRKAADKPKSKHVQKKLSQRQARRSLEPHLAEQFNAGRLYACISSRPGQVGRCDGYILEGKELDFYLRKLQKKK